MIINPSGITNKKGKPINYTIALFIKLPKPNETLDDFIREIVSKYPDKKKLNICAKYPGQLSYEFFDNDMYKEIGGAHMDIIGLERNEPEYDGLIWNSLCLFLRVIPERFSITELLTLKVDLRVKFNISLC